MVNFEKENNDIEIETTNDENIEIEDTELAEEEVLSSDRVKRVKDELKLCVQEKMQIQDELQRAKADFLNAKKRLESERDRDRIRMKIAHVEDLLPLCDSFYMAMNDKEIWEKTDKSWRSGIEGIQAQLNKILEQNQVSVIDPVGDTFDPHKHEAVGTEEVEDEHKQDVVISVVQRGYEIQNGENTEVIRPARVTTGIVNK